MKPSTYATPLHALKEAIRLHKTQDAFAKAIGKRQSYVSMLLGRMKNSGAKVPQDICGKVQKATRGKVRREDLRPDLNWDVVERAVRVPYQAGAPA